MQGCCSTPEGKCLIRCKWDLYHKNATKSGVPDYSGFHTLEVIWKYNIYEFTCHNMSPFVSINLLHFKILYDWFFPIFTYYWSKAESIKAIGWICCQSRLKANLEVLKQQTHGYWTLPGPAEETRKKKKNLTNHCWQWSDSSSLKIGKKWLAWANFASQWLSRELNNWSIRQHFSLKITFHIKLKRWRANLKGKENE